jgi:two-component system chemotaxis response regulator CheB
MRQNLQKILSSITDFQPKYLARHGLDALEIIRTQNDIDVILLDLFMPKLDGISTLKEIMTNKPIPTLIFTSADRVHDEELLLTALKLGALDIIHKPTGLDTLKVEEVMGVLIEKIRVAAKSKEKLKVFVNNAAINSQISSIDTSIFTKPPEKQLLAEIKIAPSKDGQPDHIFDVANKNKVKSFFVLGASTGGPSLVMEFVRHLKFSSSVAGIIVQHMPAGFTNFLAKRLDQSSQFVVVEAEHGQPLQPGHIYVAPGDYHLKLIENNNGVLLELTQDDRVWGVRPCVDYALITAAQIFKEKCIGIILTGMGRDGTLGMRVVKEYGGFTIAQDPTEAMIDSMPLTAIKSGYVDLVMKNFDIVHYLNREYASL